MTDNVIRYAIDDTLTDGIFDIGEDLFETDRSGELENPVKLNPEAAVSAIYNSVAKTAQRVFSESRSVKISDAVTPRERRVSRNC